MRRILILLSALLLILLAVLLIEVGRLPAAPATQAGTRAPPIDPAAAQGAAERLAEAVRIRTISVDAATPTDAAAFTELAALLARQFPQAHATLRRETIAGGSLLYTWPGRDRRLAPLLLLAHLDVVPVEPGTEARWTHPPFAGVIADGHVWGRGTIDDKAAALGLLEAVEALVATGFVPPRDVLLAFGHDEEIGGTGAQAIAATLAARGVRAWALIDEGGAITRGLMPGVQQPVATVMTAEKGYVSFRLVARAVGGHSSQPPPDPAVSRLARALTRLADQPLPARLTPTVATMLERAAPAMPFAQRLAIANRWLFEPLLLRLLAGSPPSNAMIRTTLAPTVLRAGVKDNVLPSEAEAVINLRLLPGDTIAAVEARLRATIDDDDIELRREAGFGNEASPVSAADGPAWQHLQATIEAEFPDARVVPGLMFGASDARHYEGVYAQRYNFLPLTLTGPDLDRIHGTDERIAIADYARLIAWYQRLIETLPGATIDAAP